MIIFEWTCVRRALCFSHSSSSTLVEESNDSDRFDTKDDLEYGGCSPNAFVL